MEARILIMCVVLTLISACQKKATMLVEPKLNVAVKNVMLDEGRGGIGPCEPSICINPNNPEQILAGVVLDRVYAPTQVAKPTLAMIFSTVFRFKNRLMAASHGMMEPPLPMTGSRIKISSGYI